MKSDSDLESELRSALGQYHDLRLKILEYNRRQLGEKLDRLEQQIERSRESRDKSIEAQFKALVDGTAKRPHKPHPDRAASGAPAKQGGKASPPKPSKSDG